MMLAGLSYTSQYVIIIFSEIIAILICCNGSLSTKRTTSLFRMCVSALFFIPFFYFHQLEWSLPLHFLEWSLALVYILIYFSCALRKLPRSIESGD
ncbi:hypothetical protein BN3662_01420 [Clostridiales bacterium CHKCI006]|nr:hypothetical protein BN3662_01420 [Clostridiales bacterium CHKCI006]